ncbi:MAG TPA: 50S ribosomal protein L4 [Candidatus Sulfotelmatobacter sp.]|jgi:large subunit ribosomal protein L4|nr:50S ribosomal protein L4 [Candidatus Sulfotelmatobacter sp.]
MVSKAAETKKTVKITASKPAVTSVKKETIVKVAKPKAAVEKIEAEFVIKQKITENKYATVSVEVIGIDGKITGKVSLPGEIFGEKINKALIAQTVRVYLANQRQGNASTKTRGEVDGSTRKIYRQKGTGRARHGSVRAPIFVKGGVVFGPKPRDYSLALPQKMKKKALFSVLSAKVKDNELTIIDGLGAIKPKTKIFVEMLQNLGMTDKKQKLLFVTVGKDVDSVIRAGRNVEGVNFLSCKQINTYEVLAATRLVVMKDAIEEMKQHFLKK